MQHRRKSPVRLVVVAIAMTTLALVAVKLLQGAQALPERPRPVAWDRDACAHCRMLVGEPAFAAQLVTVSGEVLNFDDPGCAFEYMRDEDPRVHRIWFHTESGEWLDAGEVAFVSSSTTPMGFGLQAVPSATPGSIDFERARARFARRAEH